jgi:hypothetical protein
MQDDSKPQASRTYASPGKPGARTGTGFVGACWLEPIDGIGMPVIIFQTKEHATKAAAYPLPPLPGVTPRTLENREVYASA